MNTSTIEARRGSGKRFGVFLLGLVVACAGAFSVSATKADAAGFEMNFDKGAINLGAAFKGQQILPAPKTVSGTKAAYWWEAVDTGYATDAALGWAEAMLDDESPFQGVDAENIYDSLGVEGTNVCTTPYAAWPEKPENAASPAEPNELFPCSPNPPGGTVGATGQADWLGFGPCETFPNCFADVSEAGNIVAPIDVNPVTLSAGEKTGIAVASGCTASPPAETCIPPTVWGSAPFDNPNDVGDPTATPPVVGDLPFGFLDQVIPLTQTTMERVYDPATATTKTELSIGANAFRFPVMIVPSPLDGSPVPITLAVKGAPIIPGVNDAGIPEEDKVVTGEYNPDTGELSLEGALESRVLVGLGIDAVPESPAYPEDPPADQKGGASPFVYCSVPLTGLTLNTTGASTATGGFPGTPFYNGLEGEGAIAGTFNIQGDSTPTVLEPFADPDKYTGEQAPDCGTVNTVTQGQGALWLGSGDVEAPVCEASQVGSYPDCQDPKTSFGKPVLKVKKSVKAGKKIRLTLRVKNNGNVEGTARVRVQTSNGKAKAPKLSVGVTADPGKNGSKTVRLATKKRSKGKVVLYATVGNRTGKATVRIK